jgi:hypothetical protein
MDVESALKELLGLSVFPLRSEPRNKLNGVFEDPCFDGDAMTKIKILPASQPGRRRRLL